MIDMAEPCPTCAAINAVLRAAKVPAPVAKAVSRSKPARQADKAIRRTKTVRKASEYQKKLSKHMKKERDKATKADGSFRKGMNQAKVMARAHKCVKREMKRR